MDLEAQEEEQAEPLKKGRKRRTKVDVRCVVERTKNRGRRRRTKKKERKNEQGVVTKKNGTSK